MDLEYRSDDDQLDNREAEVIDVEEEMNENDGFPFDEEFFKSKLREKPEFPASPKGCGTAWPKKSYRNFIPPPAAERLSVPTLTSIDLIRRTIPFPKGCLPPLSLPSWHLMPLDYKIPLVQAPKNLFYYTRGKLGEKLHRRPAIFCLRDPYNRERVISESYTALHDPSVKPLLFSPLMRSFLYRKGFINEDNEVLCSLSEFNRFRNYLRIQYCDQIWKEFELADAFWKSERQQLRTLLRAESQAEGIGRRAIINSRIAEAKKLADNVLEFKRQRQQQKDQMTETRLRQWRMERERKIMEQVMRGIEEARRNKERLQALYDLRLQQRRDIMAKTTRKFLETMERQQNDKAMMQAAYNKFLLEWIESKYVFCYEKLIMRKQIQEDLRGALKYRARQRQLRLESYREQLPDILEKHKANTARINALVRKFAMRWLQKVRARLNAPKDLKHESCWIGQGKNVLDETVKYLRQESGYEKLDDFILNIMKLKKQIQQQIELEEAEEAALALLAAEEGEAEEE